MKENSFLNKLAFSLTKGLHMSSSIGLLVSSLATELTRNATHAPYPNTIFECLMPYDQTGEVLLALGVLGLASTALHVGELILSNPNNT